MQLSADVSEREKLYFTSGFLLVSLAAALAMHMTGHDPAEAGREILTAIFSSLATILYGQLKGKG